MLVLPILIATSCIIGLLYGAHLKLDRIEEMLRAAKENPS